MRVLHIISGLGTGGAETMLMKLVGGGGRHDHSVASLSGMGDLGPALQGAGVEVSATNMRSLSGLALLPWLRGLVGQVRPDLIQGWMPHGNLAAVLASTVTRRKIPMAWNIRQSLTDLTYERPLTRRLIRFNARLSRRPRSIIYNSVVGAMEHEALGYAPERRHLIPNGFDLARFSPSPVAREQMRQELGIAQDEVAIGLVARFHSMKNHAGFFEAASLVLKQAPFVRFVLAGSGMEASNSELMAMIGDSGVRSRSLFLGNRPDVDRVNLALDLACNVSLHGEGFPNAIGEAMACAVPCVVTGSGDSAAIVADGGLICGDTSSATIAAGMLRLVEAGGDERARLGQIARKRMEDHFSLPAIVARYDDLYDDIAADAVGSEGPRE